MPTEQGKIMKKRKEEGKCEINGQNVCGKTEKNFAHQTHLDHTQGTQQIKHQLIINVLYMEYKASDDYVFISSNRQKFKQGGNYELEELEIYDRH